MLKNKLIFSSSLFLMLIALTLMLFYVDVVNVNGNIGLYSLNDLFATYTVNSTWDLVTQIILNINFILIFVIVIIGVVQAIMRRSLVKICRNVVVSEILIISMLISTLLLSHLIYVNGDPLHHGGGVSNYPSNHIVIVTFVSLLCATLVKDYYVYVRFNNVNIIAKYLSFGIAISVTGLMFVGKVLSGRVWLTDAISGLLLGLFFYSLFLLFKEKKHN